MCLIDVYPDRTPYNIFLTNTNPYRTHRTKEAEEGPKGSRLIEAEIMLPPTSALFRKGHRIRGIEPWSTHRS